MKKIIILGGGDLAKKTIELINRDKLFKIIGYYNNQRSIKDIVQVKINSTHGVTLFGDIVNPLERKKNEVA